jgi:hypothetical protein
MAKCHFNEMIFDGGINHLFFDKVIFDEVINPLFL